MRGADFLLASLAMLPDGGPAGDDARPSARERLEAELGPELAAGLLARLARPSPAGSPPAA